MTHAPKSTSPIRPIFIAQGLDIANLSASQLPVGFSVERLDSSLGAAEIYTWTGSGWEDAITLIPVTTTSINGLIRFMNPAAYDIGITW